MADVVFHNGPIYTFDAAQPRAEALLMRDERIVAVGTAGAVRAAAHGGYDAIDLRGRALLPGLTDAHIHLLWVGVNRLNVMLDGVTARDEALQRIAAHAATLAPDAWVRGHGWDHSLWGNAWPTAAELDRVTGGRPALLSRKDAHSVWVNSRALALAGIDATTTAPDGGAILHDDTGAPLGILQETAMALARRVVPDYSWAEKRRALRDIIAACNAVGLTSLHLPEGPDCFALLQDLYAANELNARTLNYVRHHHLDEAIALGLRSGLGDDWIKIGGVKMFSDGALGSQTCYMLHPFAGTDNVGLPIHSVERLNADVLKAATNGLSVMIHAIGDRANRMVLDAIAQPAVQAARCALPHRLEHAQHLNPADVRRIAQLGMIASMQPIHATADREITERLLGAERAAWSYAWQPLLASGARLAFGSDAPVETFDPWAGLHAAVTRQRPGDATASWHPELALSVQDALDAYILGPTHTSCELPIKGSLTSGKVADLVVLNADPFAVDANDLANIKPDYTFVGGRAVWEG